MSWRKDSASQNTEPRVQKSDQSVISALIFDLGKVVFDFSLDSAVAAWAGAAGLETERLKSRLVQNEDFSRYERGELELEFIHRKLCDTIGREIPLGLFTAAWLDIFRGEIPGIRSVLQELRRHCRLVALSNTNADHARVWRRLYGDVLACFDTVFASNEIGARKPEPRAFAIVLESLGLLPAEVVFVDDSQENVRAASALGMPAILFRNVPQLRRELIILGVPVSTAVNEAGTIGISQSAASIRR